MCLPVVLHEAKGILYLSPSGLMDGKIQKEKQLTCEIPVEL